MELRAARITNRLRLALPAVLAVPLVTSLACFGMAVVDGERSASGDCPVDEDCSEATPLGLRFVGTAMFDEGVLRLGPVLVGGTFELGLRTADGAALSAFAFETADAAVLTATRGEGVFGPTTDDGQPFYPVEGYLTLTGAGPGSTYLRITEPGTGRLHDRIRIDAYEIADVRITNASDPEREHLLAGCREMLGVRLIASDGETELRAFDQEIVMRADGEVAAEPAFWDCFLYRVPADRSEVTVEVDAAGQTFTRRLSVRTLEEAGLDECPAVESD